MKKKLLFLVALLVLVLACVGTAMAANTDMIVGEGDLIHITTINGHVVEPGWTIITPWSCTQEGLVEFRCLQGSSGTVHYHYVGVTKSPHTWSDTVNEAKWGKITGNPSCTEVGVGEIVCTVCGAVKPGTERYVNKLAHSYKLNLLTKVIDGKEVTYFGPGSVYEVSAANKPTCAKTGLGYVKCTKCGYYDTQRVYTILPLAHDWTDWTITKEGNCKEEGYAVRACVICGAHQKLNSVTILTDFAAYDVVDYNNVTLPFWNANKAKIQQKNTGWSLLGPNNEFKSTKEMDDKLDKYGNKGQKWEFVVSSIKTCYDRYATVTCAYCRGKWHTNQKNIEVNSKTQDLGGNWIDSKYGIIAHQWVKANKTSPSASFYANGKLKKFDTTVAQLGNKPATCTEDGWDLYICIHDQEALSWFPGAGTYKDEGTAEAHKIEPVATRFRRVATKATGHNWGSWGIQEKYTKKGIDYVLMVRTCSKCFGTEEKVLKAGEITVDSIKLSKHKLTLHITKHVAAPTVTIKATVKPAGAPVFWASSDEEVATVVDGVIVGLKKGTATISLQAANGSVIDECVVKVKDDTKKK